MTNSPAARMASRMAELGIGQQEVANRLGESFSRQQVNKLKTGDTRMTIEWAMRLAPALETTAEWLLGVEGLPVILGAENLPPPSDRAQRARPKERVIPEVDVQPQAGGGAVLADLDGAERHPVTAHWSIPTHVLDSYISDASSLVVIQVSGDSMEPDYLPGERVLVDTNHHVPSPPGVYVIWDGYGVVLKRVELLIGSHPERIRFKSINPAYETYERDLSEVQVNGRVVGKWVWR